MREKLRLLDEDRIPLKIKITTKKEDRDPIKKMMMIKKAIDSKLPVLNDYTSNISEYSLKVIEKNKMLLSVCICNMEN